MGPERVALLRASSLFLRRFFSRPAMIKEGSLSSATRYSLTFPPGERQPIFPPLFSQNQMLPSGPAAMPIAPLWGVGISNSVTSPFVVIRPILFALHWVNQRAPSVPTQMHRGPPGPISPCLGVGNSVTSPFVVILPIFSRLYSVNQRAPSGPATMLWGPQRSEGMGNSVMSPFGVIFPIL